VTTCTDAGGGVQSLCAVGGSLDGGCDASAVAYWSGDGTVVDLAAGEDAGDDGGSNGALFGDAGFGAGLCGEAFAFDGVNQYATFGATAGNFGTSDFTIDFWLSTTSTGQEALIDKRQACNHGSFFDVHSNSGFINFEVDQDASATNYGVIVATANVNDGNWHHVTCVRQGTSLSIYIDGALSGSGSTAGVTDISNPADLQVGLSPCLNVPSETFVGLIQQVALFDVALPPGG
jgi:hypothetical protein